MQTLKFLGRGSAFNIVEGNTSAYIKENNELLLIDCGESVFEKIVNKNLLDDVKDVHVLITHLDSDHVGSLSSLIYYCYYIKHIVPNIYFPNNSLYDLLNIQGHINGQDYKFNFIDANTNNFYNIANIKNIKPIKVEHIKTLNCYGYLLYRNNNKLIWYSGDCNKVSNVLFEYSIDEFYQDTCLADYEGNVHTSLKVLSNTIVREYRYKIYCMHIDCDELIEKAKIKGFNVVEVEE